MSCQQEEIDLQQEAFSLSSSFTDVIEKQLPSLVYSYITPSTLNINTMTIVCKTNLTNFNTHVCDFKEYISKNPIEDGITLSEKSMGKNVIIIRWNQKWGEDNNHQKNISAKVFGNGSIHITGVTMPYEAILISDFLSKFFSKLIDKNENNKPEAKTLDFTICMIQSNFSIGRHIRLAESYQIWQDKGYENKFGASALFDYEKHRVLHLKFTDEKTSVLIFSTGKILITGARSPEHLHNSYDKTCTFFDQNIDDITFIKEIDVNDIKIPKKRGRKRKIDQISAYETIDINKL